MPPGPRDVPDPSLLIDTARSRTKSSRALSYEDPPPSTSTIDVHGSDLEESDTPIVLPGKRKKKQVLVPQTPVKGVKVTTTSLPRSPIKSRFRKGVPETTTGGAEGNNTATSTTTQADPDMLDDDRFLADIQLTALTGGRKKKEDTNKDLDHFFGPIYQDGGQGGKVQSRRLCLVCPRGNKSIVSQPTTLRRHMEATHEAIYHRWATKNGFLSALPKDRKARKDAAAIASGAASQPTLDKHLHEPPPREKLVMYTDEVFKEAALDWLIATDQPIEALNHPKFKHMIDIASRAKNGVSIPGQGSTRAEIIELFQKRMLFLKEKLNIGYLTTDNATNNASTVRKSSFAQWDADERHLPCMAHIINLATQAFISTYSKSPHFDPKNPENHLPNMVADICDKVGLIRAIAVKERSSSKRKELFLRIQAEAVNRRTRAIEFQKTLRTGDMIQTESSIPPDPGMPQQLILDMKFIPEFIELLTVQASTADERTKLRSLNLTESEWKRAIKFASLLQHANNAQQSFSSGTIPTLHNAIPASEALHAAWTKRAGLDIFKLFRPALEAGAAKINEYYIKTAKSSAHVIALVLDPHQKGRYFLKHWGKELAAEARQTAEKTFKERWEKLNGPVTNLTQPID
ncbi:putative AC transposase [Mycena indigotica]|uniref:Putative AC transposase n=1 Tax=Mycena indigotica TaxID=2126181 RepID=A0A8H6T6B6_9AGAR|nr:putative AC transposase [Mycena indigotica]KAF7311751.1 putative AC transposase [Mycena indigotica]